MESVTDRHRSGNGIWKEKGQGRAGGKLKSEFFVCCPESLPFSIITTSVNSFLRYGEQQAVLVYNANDA